MADILDGGGVYRHDHILGDSVSSKDIRALLKHVRKVSVPQIEEIRAIRGVDGEDYINLNDLATAMEMRQSSFPSLSVMLFVKTFIKELLTARRY